MISSVHSACIVQQQQNLIIIIKFRTSCITFKSTSSNYFVKLFRCAVFLFFTAMNSACMHAALKNFPSQFSTLTGEIRRYTRLSRTDRLPLCSLQTTSSRDKVATRCRQQQPTYTHLLSNECVLPNILTKIVFIMFLSLLLSSF